MQHRSKIVGKAWRIVSRQFDAPIFAAPAIPPASDFSIIESEAAVYDDRDNPAIKLPFWQMLANRTGLDGSKFVVEFI